MSIVTLGSKLKNPFALVGEGFLFGVVLFWAISAHESSAHQSHQSVPAVERQG